MTQETLQRAKVLDADMWRLEEDAQNCQMFIEDTGDHDYFVGCEGCDNLKVAIPKAVLTEALKIVHKGITDQHAKLKQEFDSL